MYFPFPYYHENSNIVHPNAFYICMTFSLVVYRITDLWSHWLVQIIGCISQIIDLTHIEGVRIELLTFSIIIWTITAVPIVWIPSVKYRTNSMIYFWIYLKLCVLGFGTWRFTHNSRRLQVTLKLIRALFGPYINMFPEKYNHKRPVVSMCSHLALKCGPKRIISVQLRPSHSICKWRCHFCLQTQKNGRCCNWKCRGITEMKKKKK